MQDELFKTRYSKYGYGIDVRRTYKDLPCQPFWTWVTGKSLNDRPPRRPKDTLLKPWRLYLHISWGYAVFFLAVIYGQQLLASQQPLWLKCLLGALIMCLVVNRQRGFLHTFHYTTHGASLENKALARFTCKWILSIPILHTPRDEYVKLHVNEHHSVRTFNTEHDVDLVFMKQHGFYKGMSESAFWTRLVLAPFHPARILEHLKFRFDVSFVSAPRHERVSRALYWAALLGLVYASGYLEAFALFYLFPIFILTQYSSWIQHVSEHLWFARNEHGLPRFLHYGSLSRDASSAALPGRQAGPGLRPGVRSLEPGRAADRHPAAGVLLHAGPAQPRLPPSQAGSELLAHRAGARGQRGAPLEVRPDDRDLGHVGELPDPARPPLPRPVGPVRNRRLVPREPCPARSGDRCRQPAPHQPTRIPGYRLITQETP